jgi:phosphohistidine phosphatase
MKRTLVMIRHAKSSWANPLQSDFERRLSDRGEHDAPAMGERLKKQGLIPDLIIASSAKRTKQTARKIAKEVGYDPEEIRYEEKLYHCIPPVFEEVLADVKDKVNTVFIVAHNPGITEFVNQFSPEFKVDNMPTCGIVGVHVETDEWNSFAIAKKKVFLFDYPRNDNDSK